MSAAVTVEHKIFLTRAKSVGEILKGLLVVVAFGPVIVLITYSTANPWFLILAAAPLGYGWHLIALAWSGLFRRVVSDAPGTARWSTIEDLKKAEVVGKTVDPRHHVYCGLFNGVPVHDDSDRHIVTMGATRRGKDTGLMVQNLAMLDESFVVLDPSGELAAITIASRKKRGLTFVFNPFGVLVKTHPHLKSSGFNPIPLDCSPDSDSFFAQGMGFGESVVPRGSIKDSHWDEGAMQFGMVLWMRAKWFQKEGRVLHATVRHVMDMATAPYAKQGAKDLKSIMQEITRHPDEQMVKLAQRFVAEDDDREVKGVLSTAAGKIKSLNDRTILADMDKHPMVDGVPFDFEMLKHRVITVYIILPDEMLKTHATWLRLVVANAINALKRSPPGPVRPILLLNEIGNLGYMESLDTAMGMIAKKGVKIWTAWQSLSQISRIYGDHGRETFLSGAGVLNSFKADDLETAEYLSRRLGRQTKVTSSYNAKTSGTDTASKTDSAGGFPLMHPDQIMGLPPRTLLSWIDRLPHPVKLDAPGYFDMPSIKGMAPNPYYVARKV